MLSDTNLIDDAMPVPRKSIYSLYIKRAFDILFSGFAIIVLLPILIIITILELIFHGRPVLYVSQRPGKNCEIFNVYKFRSMTEKTDENGELLPEELRLTKFGKFLRRTSLDELPQLWSIFIGNMSIVGPRPLLIEYLELYSPRHKMRHIVRPGLALVRTNSNKDGLLKNRWTWRDQFENDIYYIENMSFLLDFKMIIAIALTAIKGDSSRTDDTRVRYNGENLDEIRTKQEIIEKYKNEENIVFM